MPCRVGGRPVANYTCTNRLLRRLAGTVPPTRQETGEELDSDHHIQDVLG